MNVFLFAYSFNLLNPLCKITDDEPNGQRAVIIFIVRCVPTMPAGELRIASDVLSLQSDDGIKEETC